MIVVEGGGSRPLSLGEAYRLYRELGRMLDRVAGGEIYDVAADSVPRWTDTGTGPG